MGCQIDHHSNNGIWGLNQVCFVNTVIHQGPVACWLEVVFKITTWIDTQTTDVNTDSTGIVGCLDTGREVQKYQKV